MNYTRSKNMKKMKDIPEESYYYEVYKPQRTPRIKVQPRSQIRQDIPKVYPEYESRPSRVHLRQVHKAQAKPTDQEILHYEIHAFHCQRTTIDAFPCSFCK